MPCANGIKPPETLRVEWVPGTYSDIETYITAEGLSHAVPATVPLENSPSGHIVSTGRSWGSILVDLAVATTELRRVRGHFRCVSLPLDNLSLINIPQDSTDPERQDWLRSRWVYSKYLRQNARAIQSGNALKPVLEWYEMRLNEMSTVMMRNRRMEA